MTISDRGIGRFVGGGRVAFLSLLTVIAVTTVPRTAAETAPSQVKDGDRIVFVGDSITGQGVNAGPGGFINLIKEGLDTARPGSQVTVVALGGSGQGVGSWVGVEKGSREKESFLDVPRVGVKENLDQHADILVIMLGMNDSLAPYVGPEATSLDNWAKQYRELIAALRARTTPRVTALGTVTPNTEDPKSPKNRVLTEMSQRLALIAKEEACVLLPTRETVFEVLQKGRTLKPDFHVTYDFVHPNAAGHPGIAVGMLKGLGEAATAEALAAKYLAQAYVAAQGTLPALSYTITPTALPLTTDDSTFEIRYFWTVAADAAASQPRARLQAPPGWQVTPAELAGPSGTFTVSGKPDRLENRFKLQLTDGAAKRETEVVIPAPWLIGTGVPNPGAWENPGQKYAPDKGVLPGEERLTKGLDFGTTPEGWKGTPPAWGKYVASVDHTGGATPGNVCLYAATFATTFEAAYGARWLFSDQELPVELHLGSSVFAGQIGVVVWLNGERLYAGVITGEPQRKAVKPATLKKGWNCLVFKTNHCTWQWQFSLDLTSNVPGAIENLRVAAVPPKAK